MYIVMCLIMQSYMCILHRSHGRGLYNQMLIILHGSPPYTGHHAVT